MADRYMKTVFDWEHFALYLSGPIDFTMDGGNVWRDEWTEKLIDIGINQKQIYNPCKKPFHGAQYDLDDEAAIGRECRAAQDWERLDDVMGQVMHVDLRLVDKADIILVNMPQVGPNNEYVRRALESVENESSGQAVHQLARAYAEFRVPTYGTIHEIVIAHMQRKPIFMVWEGNGLDGCSSWLMKLVGYKNVFLDADSLIRHLKAISQGKKAFNANEWLLLDPK